MTDAPVLWAKDWLAGQPRAIESPSVGDMARWIVAQDKAVTGLQARVKEAEANAEHWKANHDHIKARIAVLEAEHERMGNGIGEIYQIVGHELMDHPNIEPVLDWLADPLRKDADFLPWPEVTETPKG